MKLVFARVRVLLLLLVSFNLFALAIAQDESGEFTFRTPVTERYRLDSNQPKTERASDRPQWVRARRHGTETNDVEFGNRLVLQLDSPSDLKELTAGFALTSPRVVSSNTFILQTPDAVTAMQLAHRLAAAPNVRACYPIVRRQNVRHGPYAPAPSDFYYPTQWTLEHRSAGWPAGVDLNVRAAWPFNHGEGITVAVVDTGIELNHRELTNALAGGPHFNFALQNTNAGPIDRSGVAAHGTEVAGLIAAGLNNWRIVGVAPGAKLASWAIFDTNGFLATDEQLMDMYQYQPSAVSVQNHSWGAPNGFIAQYGPTPLERIGIQNAVTVGRNGLGTVFVRSGGNDRAIQGRADDDGYASDPQVIGVGAVNINGRAASYSEPGACILVSAPSGDSTTGANGLFTTDLIGTDGADPYLFCPPSDPTCPTSDLSDYVFYNQFVNMDGFSGTSASAPEISGVAALILSTNPSLSYRDVQQILILSSRHFDFADPDLTTNAAGFVVSHNDAFGGPHPGQAVQLARFWSNCPPLSVFSLTDTQPAAIPDDALRVEISGDGVPAALTSISARPDVGVQPDSPTASLPLVDVGLATNVPAINLTNKAALILRGVNNFIDKISNAAAAGAAFVIVYNTNGDDNLIGMGATDYAPIPAVLIGNTDGEALKSLFATNSSARARIHLQTMDKTFHVNTALSCEQVGVRVQSDHPVRGQLRITLLSPQGTRSVLQPYNIDPTPGPVDWTYWSTHHFFEGSAGDWKVSFADEVGGSTGSVRSVTLIVRGTQITDADQDGLDDAWEMAHFGSLTFGPKDDPDGDGAWNAREQLTGTDPAAIDHPLAITFSWWDLSGTKLARLTWPSAPQYVYQLFGGTNLSSLSLITNMPGRFPETEWLGPVSPGAQFYKLFSQPAP